MSAAEIRLLATDEGVVVMQLERPLSNFRDLGVVDLDLVDRPRGYGRCSELVQARQSSTGR